RRERSGRYQEAVEIRPVHRLRREAPHRSSVFIDLGFRPARQGEARRVGDASQAMTLEQEACAIPSLRAQHDEGMQRPVTSNRQSGNDSLLNVGMGTECGLDLAQLDAIALNLDL